MAYKRILAAVDGSEHGDRAAVKAGVLARDSGAELLLATVEPRQPIPEDLRRYAHTEHLDEGPTSVWENIAREVLRRAREHVEDTAGGALTIRTLSLLGEPAHAILEASEDQQADLIVAGSRGFGRLTGLMLGSVSQKLAGTAKVDVLIVKG